ncbi:MULTISPECIES: TonB family protein [unclassified Yoonia]|uniref:energy transducer TonB n=1 Tax=unclassified Yoonia TaxID=2629118 RepID=UPI002AFDFC9F|nr:MULTISPECIES: TonB family protein [unclassified Yoonia]
MTRMRALIGGAAALTLSGALHAAVLLIATPQDEPVLMSGGGTADIAALGAAFEDFAAGSMPVVPAAQPAVQVPATQPNLTLPSSDTADLAVPVAPTTATAPPVTGATAPPPETASNVAPEVATAITTEPAPATSIRPVARPAQRPQQRAQAAPPRPAGNAETDANRGSAQGQQGGQAVAAGAAPTQDMAGGQAAANYPGQVLRQITRLRRQTARTRGTVMVSFAVAGSGALADVAVAQSSGSAALDQMALDHIRRAAPFPPPPAGAQTSFRFEFVGRP